MCKKLGAYPNCQCPGFNGEPASSDDTRGCYTQYCQDPTAPCPNDAFVNCVKENTKAFLQWQAVFSRISHGFDSMLQVASPTMQSEGCSIVSSLLTCVCSSEYHIPTEAHGV